VIIPDINLLIYAYDSTSRFHPGALRWWEELLSGTETVGLPWISVLGFLRIMTNPRVMQHPMPMSKALKAVEQWMERPNICAVSPGPGHFALLARFLDEAGGAANLTTDAHLAALAVEHKGILHTSDTDFGRFAGLKWVNPLPANPAG
jgi:uncharacterized protein